MTNERPRAGVQLDDGAWQQRFQLSGRFARERSDSHPTATAARHGGVGRFSEGLGHLGDRLFAICSVLFAMLSRVVVSSSLVGGERMRLTSRRKVSKLLARESVGY